MAAADDLRNLLRSYGVADGFVATWAGDPLAGPAPLAHGRANTWLVAPMADGSWVVGGTDRGTFAPYDFYESLELCANAVRHLYFAPVEAALIPPAESAQAVRLATDLTTTIVTKRTADPTDVRVGVGLDRYGPLSGHVLFPWRTPFPLRSSPPSDLELDYVQLIVRRPLPGPLEGGVMVPWFEQPGGGCAISLPRCVRWYFDAGYLDVFRVAA